MSKRSFTPSERYAVFTTHGEVCYLCNRPLDLESFEVEHVIPETLEKDPVRLEGVLKDLGRPANFSLNSYANWMPACRRCNGKKGELVFEPSLLVQVYLQKAASKAAKAEELEREEVSQQKMARAMNTLSRAISEGKLQDGQKAALQSLLRSSDVSEATTFHNEHRAPEMIGQPIRLTPLFEIVDESSGVKVIRGPYGYGVRPVSAQAQSGFNCPNCASIGAWSGARCVICGMMDED